ncbi:SAM-dependent methyltransferase [Actinomadura sp. NPDC023710]|uniref:SAM-dependent methyltransferase n=1 Tax=Actinomadura sp. NPDC023710 TaxID=3158219 RepID=UPI0033E33F39
MTEIPAAKIDQTVPHAARVWDHLLGGKENYEVDRQVADKIIKAMPEAVDLALTARQFKTRVVRHLAKARDVAQFLDIGPGLPAATNTHDVAQHIKRAARVIYVDNDPLVLALARALLPSTTLEGGTCQYVEADLRDPNKILREARETFDWGRPVARPCCESAAAGRASSRRRRPYSSPSRPPPATAGSLRGVGADRHRGPRRGRGHRGPEPDQSGRSGRAADLSAVASTRGPLIVERSPPDRFHARPHLPAPGRWGRFAAPGIDDHWSANENRCPV